MARYCVNTNAQANGDHEVHDTSIERWCLPAASHRKDLGYHVDCSSAVRYAKQNYYTKSNGCANCASGCHTS